MHAVSKRIDRRDKEQKSEPRHDKTNKVSVCPAKTQVSLGIRPVWSESSLCAQWVAKDSSFLHADSEDSDQTGRIPRLIWVFVGRTLILLVLSWCGSVMYNAVSISNIILFPYKKDCDFIMCGCVERDVWLHRITISVLWFTSPFYHFYHKMLSTSNHITILVA